MPEFHFDTSELDRLERELRLAHLKVIPAIVPVAHRAGSNIKGVMKADASGHSHLGGLPATVNYDLDVSPREVSVEVGFRKIGQGNLANFAAFGSVNNAPVMDITRGLTAEVPRFMQWVAKIGSEAL